MEVRASVTGVRVSPRKARLVVDAVRGKRVMDAIALTRFMPNKTAADVEQAAASRWRRTRRTTTTWIRRISGSRRSTPTMGPSFRRFKAKARGRVGRIIRRNTHMTVIAEERRRLMGRKVNPIGFRLGIVTDWESKWYAERNYTEQLHEDLRIRRLILNELTRAGISRIELERSANKVDVTLHTSKPGIVIGKQGANVERLRQMLEQEIGKKVHLQDRRDQGAGDRCHA